MTTEAVLVIMVVLVVAGIGLAIWDEVNWRKGWRRYVEKQVSSKEKDDVKRR